MYLKPMTKLFVHGIFNLTVCDYMCYSHKGVIVEFKGNSPLNHILCSKKIQSFNSIDYDDVCENNAIVI